MAIDDAALSDHGFPRICLAGQHRQHPKLSGHLSRSLRSALARLPTGGCSNQKGLFEITAAVESEFGLIFSTMSWQELLIATRHMLSSDFRTAFVPFIDMLLDEKVLVGSGVTSREALR